MTVHQILILQECLMIYHQRKKCSCWNNTQVHQSVLVSPIFYFQKCTERTSGRKRFKPEYQGRNGGTQQQTFFQTAWIMVLQSAEEHFRNDSDFFTCSVACLNNNVAGYCRNQTRSTIGSRKKYFYQLGLIWQSNHQMHGRCTKCYRTGAFCLSFVWAVCFL